MGATEFMVRASGRNADEAFARAIRVARFEHGHGGYSGSVAEKDGFIDLTHIDGRELKRLVATRIEDKRFELARTENKWSKQNLRQELETLRRIKKTVRVKMTPEAIADALLDMDHPSIADKWGNAGCINCTPRRTSPKSKKVYLFFGLASC